MVERRTSRKTVRKPKRCAFCKDGGNPVFSDTTTLGHYITDRGKIIGRGRTGLCPKHQRRLTLAIKQARHLALLPFVSRD